MIPEIDRVLSNWAIPHNALKASPQSKSSKRRCGYFNNNNFLLCTKP